MRNLEKKPPFSSGEFPFHELGELSSCNIGVRVAVADKRKEFVAVKFIKRDEIRLLLVQQFDSQFVCG